MAANKDSDFFRPFARCWRGTQSRFVSYFSRAATLKDLIYWLQILFAAGIATPGLVLNSPAVIIGAIDFSRNQFALPLFGMMHLKICGNGFRRNIVPAISEPPGCRR